MSIESYIQEVCEDFTVSTIPFYNKEKNKIEFMYRPNKDLLYVFPRPIPEKIGNFYLPDSYKHHHRDEFGIVLAKGLGYKHKNGKFYSTEEVEVGDLVIYDKYIPAKQEVIGLDGQEYEVKLVGILDIKVVVRGEK